MHKLVPEDEKGHLLVGLMRTRITLTSSGWVRLWLHCALQHALNKSLACGSKGLKSSGTCIDEAKDFPSSGWAAGLLGLRVKGFEACFLRNTPVALSLVLLAC